MAACNKNEKSWFLALFGLPFFLGGAGLLCLSIIPTLYDAWQMSSWQETQAELLSARLISHSSSKGGTTYSVDASYRYVVDGQPYQNSHVSINSRSDNIGDFQEDLGRSLEQSYQAGEKVSAWFDPDQPANAILNRDLRPGLLGFESIFVVVFGGIGFALVYYGLRGVPPTPNISANISQPWLNHPDWQNGVLRYKGKAKVYFSWIFTLIVSLVSLPALMNIMDIWQKKGWLVLLVLLFPLIGIVMLYQSIKTTLEWWRFGDTPLRLDPFPGVIGGNVGGELLLKTDFDRRARYLLTLSCIYSYMSGSGDDRSRSEKLIWQDTVTGSVLDSHRMQFCFAVPDQLPPSESQQSEKYHLWRLDIHGNMPGVDLKRQFEIPVYQGTGSTRNAESLISAGDNAQTRPANRIEDLIPLRKNGMQTEIYYPPFRKPFQAFAIQLFGAIFCGSGWFLWREAAAGGFQSIMLYFMSAIFSLIGIIILSCGLYALLNALHISCDGWQVTSTRRILGITKSQKSAAYSSITAIKTENKGGYQSGNRHVASYQVQAVAPNGVIILAEQLDAYSKAEQVADYFRKLLGVRS